MGAMGTEQEGFVSQRKLKGTSKLLDHKYLQLLWRECLPYLMYLTVAAPTVAIFEWVSRLQSGLPT